MQKSRETEVQLRFAGLIMARNDQPNTSDNHGKINLKKEILFPWRDLLITTVDPSELHCDLLQEGFFDSSHAADELKQNLCENNHLKQDLWNELLTYLYQRPGDQPLHSFLHALKKAGYEFQEDWIRNRSEKTDESNSIQDDHRVFRHLLELFAQQICNKLNPNDLFPHFKAEGLLRQEHLEMIDQLKTHNRKVLGILHYITLSGKQDWPKRFCKVLKNAGHMELAMAIEPKIVGGDLDKTIEDFTQANTARDVNDAMEIDEAEIQGFTCGNQEAMNEALPITHSNSNKDDGRGIEDQKIGSFSSETPLKRLNIEPVHEKLNNLTQLKAEETSYAASVFSADDNTAYPEADQIDVIVTGDSDGAEPKRQRTLRDDEEQASERKELRLRKYQLELAQEPLKGLNTIIVAPTGTGKTVVAVYIAKAHLEAAAMNEHCVVFLAPYGHLVSQQKDMFHQYLPHFKVVSLQGGDSAETQVPLVSLLEQHDVVLTTPQVLVNAIKDTGPDLMRHITLLFIDECHETKKEHACKKLMSVYLDAKLTRRKNQQPLPLPQVVGLTASVGVGGAKNRKSAQEHLMKLAANLDAQKIQIVRENEEDLVKYANEPKEDYVPVEGRKDDPFKDRIMNIMEKIEMKLKCIPESDYADDSPDLKKHLLKPTAAKNTQQYMNWLSPLEQLAQKVDDNKIRRTFISAKERLEILHKGLQLNDDSESKNALEYMKTSWNEPRFIGQRHLPEENAMHQLFLDFLPDLEDMCLLESQLNPKLTKVFEILEQEYQTTGRECRIIIFVRTRELTESLVKWVESQSSISLLQPKAIVGSAELSSPEQKQILEMFQKGDCQLLIATSVAEQGLDITKCNLVIRYEYVTDDIGRMQARGRARASNARYILVTERKIGQDFINYLKEGMMGEALKSISAMPSREFEDKVKTYQILDLEERRRIKCAEAARSKMMRQRAKEFYILRCSKCNNYACSHEDLRIANDAHRMVINREFAERYDFYESPQKKYFDGFQKKGKIYCKKCGRDWGVIFHYKECDIPVLKNQGFAITFKNDENMEERLTTQRWKDIPIAVKEIRPDDLTRFLGGNPDRDGDLDCDDDDNDEFD